MAGFTLLELLVIIVMVGILAAIVAPSWLGFLNRQRMSAVKSDLVQTLKQTQQDAIQRREEVEVEVAMVDGLPTLDNGVTRYMAEGNLKSNMVTLEASYADTPGTPIAEDSQIAFDYEGFPVPSIDPSSGNQRTLPFVINITGENFSAKQCVIIANLIGSIKTAEGSACDDPKVDPVDPS